MGLGKNHIEKIPFNEGIYVGKIRDIDKIVALAGNPNVGKSTVFNQLTGLRQHTGNWPGKTVTNAQGRFTYKQTGYVIVDLPGCYSLMAHSPEEETARDFICSGVADAVIIVCDAGCLERGLNLALQTMELTPNTVLCVNLMDEAKKKKIKIDLELLSERLQVPVVGTSARSKKGLDLLMDAVDSIAAHPPGEAVPVRYPEYIEAAIADLRPVVEQSCGGAVNSRWLSLMLLYREREQIRDDIASSVVRTAEELCRGVVIFEDEERLRGGFKIDRVLTGKYTAFPVMILALLGIFWITINGANYPSELLAGLLFWIEARLLEFFIWLDVPRFLYEPLVSGVYRVLAWVVSVMLPPMAIFFPLFTLLEDAGILPRIAFNLDKAFKKCSVCGKQALTMCMGFGCNAVGVTGCRIIDSPRERLIAVITNSFVPCNGRFPTLIAVISMFFAGSAVGFARTLLEALILTAAIVLGIALTLAVSKLLSATLLRGRPSPFTLEMPPYRVPQFGKVIVRSIFDRTLFVLGRAVTVAAPAGLVIWLLANIAPGGVTLLARCTEFLDPFARVFGLDGVILLAFLLGFPANEIVIPLIIMSYMSTGNIIELGSLGELHGLLVKNGWDFVTAGSVLLFCLIHWPCSTTCLTIKKETGSLKWTAAAVIIPTVIGFLACFVFANAARLIMFCLI